MTPFEVQSALLGIPEEAPTRVRLAIRSRSTPGSRPDPRRAAGVRPPGRLSLSARRARPGLGRALRDRRRGQAGVRPGRPAEFRAPADARGPHGACLRRDRPPFTGQVSPGRSPMRLFATIASSLRIFSADVFAADPGQLASCNRGRERPRLPRRRTAAEARPLAARRGGGRGRGPRRARPARISPRCSRRQLNQLAEWQQLRTGQDGGGGRPGCRPAWATSRPSRRTASSNWRSYGPAFRSPPIRWKTALTALAADQDTAWKLPRLYQLGARFGEHRPRPAAGRACPSRGNSGPRRRRLRPRLVLLDPRPDQGPRSAIRRRTRAPRSTKSP